MGRFEIGLGTSVVSRDEIDANALLAAPPATADAVDVRLSLER